MSELIALELPEPLVKKVKEIAALNRQGIEEILNNWLDGQLISKRFSNFCHCRKTRITIRG
jgi:hypothetical protein